MTKDGGEINPVTTSHCSDASDTSSDSEEDAEVSTTIQQFNNENNYGLQTIAGIPPPVDASNLSTTVVKMKNSTNVEVKPVTQVIVHQYFQNSNQSDQRDDIDARVVPNVSEYYTKPAATGEVNLNAETEPCATPNTSKKFYHAIISCVPRKLGIIIVLGVSIAAVVVIALCVTLTKKSDGTSDTYPSNPSDLDETDYDLGEDIHILTRERWGGRRIRDGYQNRTLVHPIKLVIIGHTASYQCMTVRECSSALQTIQTIHVSKNNYVDIGYNFLVGGDGNIYQALGWDIRNYLRNNSIQIQFLGNYGFDEVLERQRIGVKALLDRGVELEKIDEDYLLIAHNQVANTESPGENLLQDIKKWPHYYNGTLT